MQRIIKYLFVGMLSTLNMSCESTSEIHSELKNITLPDNWHKNSEFLTTDENWLTDLKSDKLTALTQQALNQNHQLISQAYALEISKQQLIISGSELWPTLDLSSRSSRSKNNQVDTYASANSLNLNVNYEIDIFGKLSDADKRANYNYLAQKSLFEQAKQQLIKDVLTTWFAVIEADKLFLLYQNKVINSQENLQIIESGYQSGLNSALDVYLTRNELNNERAQVISQKNDKQKLVRQLERLIGEYPNGDLLIAGEQPLVINDIPLGLPSELITRKRNLQASWYALLAKDANLAYAHKQRFPSLKLSASIGDSAEDIGDLLSSSTLAWSLLGNITAPIFNSGALEANEEKTRLELKQQEQEYLDTLYAAFSSVENEISTENSLKQRYKIMLSALENAQIAAELSFEKYQSGIVNYITVLDAQKRAFDARSTLIKIKGLLIQNRLNLHFSLGGGFTSPSLDTNKAQ